MNRFLLFFIFFSLLFSQSRITVNSKSEYLIYKKTIIKEVSKKHKSGSKEEQVVYWTALTMFLMDYVEKYDPNPASAYDFINKGLYQVLEGIKIKDIQNNPSKYAMQMYMLKRYITISEHLVASSTNNFIDVANLSDEERVVLFSDKIELIDQVNNILIEENTNQLVTNYFMESLTGKTFKQVQESGEHAGIELLFEAYLDGRVIQYLFIESPDIDNRYIENHFQIYLFSRADTINSLKDHNVKIIDVYMDEYKYPFFFRGGKSILHEKILLFEKYLANNFDSRELSEQFYNLLIQPIIDKSPNFLEEINWDLFMEGKFLDSTTITIIPDTAIRNIPFEALIAPESEYKLHFDGPIYLLYKYVFHYANSVREFVQNNEYIGNTVQETDMFKDLYSSDLPLDDFKRGGKRREEMLDKFAQELSKEKNDVYIFADVDYKKFKQDDLKKYGIRNISDLKFVSEEVSYIDFILSETPCCEVILSSPTETVFKDFYFSDKKDIIHIAMHGISNNNDYRKSSLLFEPDDKNDGFLEFREIIDLKIPARLIVLSACETNRGQDFTNMHSLSLQRAFKASGVENVIGTLWAIDDEATALFMGYFYAALFKFIENRNVSISLQMAKIALIGDYPDPYYWSGFVQYGLQ